jgi:flagellar biosynthesis/type III secretory pathway protein FliH
MVKPVVIASMQKALEEQKQVFYEQLRAAGYRAVYVDKSAASIRVHPDYYQEAVAAGDDWDTWIKWRILQQPGVVIYLD